MFERQSGILLHLSSLPSSFGIGDLGPESYRFIDFLSASHQSLWQILPLNPTNGVNCHSPYSSSSAFAGNSLFISPEGLVKSGLLEKSALKNSPSFSTEKVDYDSVVVYKEKIFKRTFEDFKPRMNKDADYLEFYKKNAFWLDDFALYTVIKKEYPEGVWTSWPKELKNREGRALQEFQKTFEEDIAFTKFLQYIFCRQWASLKSYANEKSISIVGDLPIYVSFDSADVWRHPEIFKLDEEKNPTVVAGVPPDYFSETGQRWGNPVYDWESLKKNGYQWWLNRIQFNLRLFDYIRVDHFRGFVNYWEIPADKKTAVKGKWQDVPTMDFFAALKKHFYDLPFIAEDLGIITDQVRQTMKTLGFPGMKILLFAFNDEKKDNLYLPHNYENSCVVYTGTHDNNTVRGWFEHEATKLQKEHIKEYRGLYVDASNISWEFIRMASESKANLCIIPLQDILGLGVEARMNKPSTVVNNWQWRLRPGALGNSILRKLEALMENTHRHSKSTAHLTSD